MIEISLETFVIIVKKSGPTWVMSRIRCQLEKVLSDQSWDSLNFVCVCERGGMATSAAMPQVLSALFFGDRASPLSLTP